MARFRVYTDADLHGPIVDGLIDRGWDAIRAIDAKPEGTDDIDHFELAVSLGRVLISNDKHMKAIAERWIDEGRSFPGLIWWPRSGKRPGYTPWFSPLRLNEAWRPSWRRSLRPEGERVGTA